MEDEDSPEISLIADLQEALEFIHTVNNPSLDNGDLDAETVARLCDPLMTPLDIIDPVDRHSLDTFLVATHGSVKIYEQNIATYKHWHPDEDILSHAAIKKKVAEWSGQGFKSTRNE
ncbi:hypothetical protein DFH08DRAFT_952349 [Mycena albidolilacea]|uniref:Uncharacterized protein n=1 Tax=Mycena albidolilacea TaxID=1033008 RepID=A0AAD7AI82_9AGAR|nr:hypothetical protein DFH08DRAFT_952349 [Mycena albidolilacea]